LELLCRQPLKEEAEKRNLSRGKGMEREERPTGKYYGEEKNDSGRLCRDFEGRKQILAASRFHNCQRAERGDGTWEVKCL